MYTIYQSSELPNFKSDQDLQYRTGEKCKVTVKAAKIIFPNLNSSHSYKWSPLKTPAHQRKSCRHTHACAHHTPTFSLAKHSPSTPVFRSRSAIYIYLRSVIMTIQTSLFVYGILSSKFRHHLSLQNSPRHQTRTEITETLLVSVNWGLDNMSHRQFYILLVVFLHLCMTFCVNLFPQHGQIFIKEEWIKNS